MLCVSKRLVATLAVVGALPFVIAMPAGASQGTVATTVLSPVVDGSAIDVDGDGSADWTYDGLGSVVVGYGHPALGPGEERGVFEFDVEALKGRCVESAQLLVNGAGSFGDWYAFRPTFTLFAGPGDGLLSTADYAGALPIARPVIYEDAIVDVTGVLRLATRPAAMNLLSAEAVRFVIAWDDAAQRVSAGILFGSSELEEVYGDAYRSAKLSVVSTRGGCRI